MTEAQSKYRLPEDCRPTHYDVTIKTDLENLTFEGFVNIALDVKRETSTIEFNSHLLTINDVSLTSNALHGNQPVKAESVNTAEKPERASVTFANVLPAQSTAQLDIRFSGKLQGTLVGYYYSKYKVDGVEKHYALTQFEPTFARQCFPCWDEPLLKATYSITMVSRKDTVNLSNMPAISEEALNPTDAKIASLFSSEAPKADTWKVTKFEKTPPVSTYLVAIANGPFEHIESSYKSPLSGKIRPLRVYATKDLIAQAQYGLDIKAKILPVYEKIFDIEFPLPKLDTLIAHDFDSGAMENWGLITGRTTAYCLNPENPTLMAKMRVATVQSHEVAHQWFGNIVTMAWWDNLWLNEGFATLMGEMIALDKIESNWNLYSRFIVDHVDEALELDAKKSSHPIEVPLENPDDINQVFDSLSYAKAGSVLRMLSEYVGEERFLKGVSIYLKKHLYGSSVTNDLWTGIAEATGLDIAAVMNNWILKIGYPVVTVSETQAGISLRQDRFLETGKPADEDNKTLWHIPLFLTTQGPDGKASLDRESIFSERETSITMDASKPFLIKGGNRGVYRVLYSPETLAKIAAEAQKPQSIISLEDKMSLVGDLAALARAGYAKTSSLLSLVESWKSEDEYLIWDTMSTSLGSVISIFWEHPQIGDPLGQFRKDLFLPFVSKLGFELRPGDTSDIISLRRLTVATAAAEGHEDVIDELKRRFKLYVETKDPKHVPADLIGTTYANVIRFGGEKEWNEMLEIYRNPADPQQKSAAMAALMASRDSRIIEKTFEFSKTEVTAGELYALWAQAAANKYPRRKLADWMMQNWDFMEKRFEGNYTHLQRLVKLSFERLSTEKDAKMVEEFFKDKDTGKFTMSLAQALDNIRSRAAWLERAKEDVEHWIKSRAL